MNRRYRNVLLFLVPILILALWIDWPGDLVHIGQRHFTTHLGLDLVGGVQVLLEADLPADTALPSGSMTTAKAIIENRSNGLLGVGEAVVQLVGDRRVLVELPGENDPEKAIEVIGETGQLEFVDMGDISGTDAIALEGQTILTDYPVPPPDANGQTVYHTVMTGTSLTNVGVQADQMANIVVTFELDAQGTKDFGNYTSQNVGKFLAIVLDKKVISIPRVNSAITSGRGQIAGKFTTEEANALAVNLRYGSLPIPLKVTQSKTIGPSLGQDSLTQSLKAGVIGLSLVLVFMAAYYRLPGVLADLALLIYVVFAYALFKIIPVTLTLPGIAGFILSIGVAVDANILIFERMREELRAGRTLHDAIDQGWRRAWSSIRDSNISTLITCTILFWFGNFYGASIVTGFAVTLALGVGLSLVTAILITRSFLHLVLDNIKFANHSRWFGVTVQEKI
jgi:preprotein translocase subunit SecD